MKEMNMTMPERKMLMQRDVAMKSVLLGKHKLMTRREPNHNVHVITPHGKVYAGRKGRTDVTRGN